MKNNYNFGVVKLHLKFNQRTISTSHKFQTCFPSQNLILFQPDLCLRKEGELNMRKKRLDKILEIPEEVYSNTPKLTITGFNEIVVENYKGILEYEEFFASISTHIGIVNINGYNINLEKMTNDDIKITGKIESVELERMQD